MIQEIMGEWYLVLSRFSAALTVPVSQVASQVKLPFLSAVLIGFVGSVSPCQLTTNISAMAYVSRRVGDGRALAEALAYTLGKVLVYMLVGSAVIFLGLQLQQVAIPVVVAARKAIGPLMILIGLGLIGFIRLRGSVGSHLARWLQSRLPRGGVSGAFFLGVVFSFTFCPTLFWLFFGLMIPMALISTGGWTFPGIFAVGTALPLLAFAGLLDVGREMSETMIDRLKRSSRRVSQFSGVILVLVGINDTLTYLFL
jgi:cytochrome c biogenesis protein CcdA